MRLPKSGNDILLAVSRSIIKAFPTAYTVEMMARSNAEFPMSRADNMNFSAWVSVGCQAVIIEVIVFSLGFLDEFVLSFTF